MELNHPKSRKRENPKQRKSRTIYKISLQPVTQRKKNEKGDGSRISGTISSKTKKTKQVEKI